jgi:Uma2 family endonuclease
MSTAKRDKLAKRISYARHGIHEYWIVEPAGGVLELYSLHDG